MDAGTRPCQPVGAADAQRDWTLASERDVQLGSLQWVLREAGVRSEEPLPLSFAPAPVLYDRKALDHIVNEALADRLTERLTCPRPKEVVHKTGQLVDGGVCCAAFPSVWAVLVAGVVDGVVDPLCSWCSEVPKEGAARFSERGCMDAKGPTGGTTEDMPGGSSEWGFADAKGQADAREDMRQGLSDAGYADGEGQTGSASEDLLRGYSDKGYTGASEDMLRGHSGRGKAGGYSGGGYAGVSEDMLRGYSGRVCAGAGEDMLRGYSGRRYAGVGEDMLRGYSGRGCAGAGEDMLRGYSGRGYSEDMLRGYTGAGEHMLHGYSGRGYMGAGEDMLRGYSGRGCAGAREGMPRGYSDGGFAGGEGLPSRLQAVLAREGMVRGEDIEGVPFSGSSTERGRDIEGVPFSASSTAGAEDIDTAPNAVNAVGYARASSSRPQNRANTSLWPAWGEQIDTAQDHPSVSTSHEWAMQARSQRSGESGTAGPYLRSVAAVTTALMPIVALQRKYRSNQDQTDSSF